MPGNSNISWTDKSWNASTGCTKVGPECDNCYADELSLRLKAQGKKNYVNGFDYTEHPELLDWPLHIKKPSKIFVASMSDPFHHKATLQFQEALFGTMKLAHWHTFQMLTKRPGKMHDYFQLHEIPPNLWVGTSVGVKKSKWRIGWIREIKQASVRFLSIEPLLEPLDLIEADLQGINWVIVGGESGSHYRPMPWDEVRKIRDLCQKMGIAFFFKQGEGRYPGQNDKLDGREWKEFPTVISTVENQSVQETAISCVRTHEIGIRTHEMKEPEGKGIS